MIEWLFIIAGIILMVIRLDRYKEVSIYLIICELLSAIFITMSVYLIIFTVPTTFYSNTIITTSSGVITANTAGNITNAPLLNSYTPMFIYIFAGVWDLLCIIFLLTDIPQIFFRKSLPKTPPMPR